MNNQEGFVMARITHFIKVFGSAIYIIVLIGVNSVGYVVDLEHVPTLLSRLLLQPSSVFSLFSSMYYLCFGVYFMEFISSR
jgi:hypothetical protein